MVMKNRFSPLGSVTIVEHSVPTLGDGLELQAFLQQQKAGQQ